MRHRRNGEGDLLRGVIRNRGARQRQHIRRAARAAEQLPALVVDPCLGVVRQDVRLRMHAEQRGGRSVSSRAPAARCEYHKTLELCGPGAACLHQEVGVKPASGGGADHVHHSDDVIVQARLQAVLQPRTPRFLSGRSVAELHTHFGHSCSFPEAF